MLCSDVCCLPANTVHCQSCNVAKGVDVVQDMREKFSEAKAKFKSLEAAIDNMEGKVQIAMDKDYLMARKTRELDERMTFAEGAIVWLTWSASYVGQMMQWHTPSTPS